MKDYDKDPIIIKNKNFKFGIFMFFVSIIIVALVFICDLYQSNTYNRIYALPIFILLIECNFKYRNSYTYFTNYQIYQKSKKEIFKEFKLSDIKSIKKSHKYIVNPSIVLKDKFNLASKSIVIISCVFLLAVLLTTIIQKNFVMFYYVFSFVLFMIFIIFYMTYGIYFTFRLIDGLNLGILKNNILIQTENEHIILLNLTKKEFDGLEEYFRNFNIEIKE